MKITTRCINCDETRHPWDKPSPKGVKIPENGIIDTICQCGHRNIFVIQQTKFELLSEMAVRAISDEYYRDAVASFTASLERLYEFFIEAVCRRRNIEFSEFANSWKEMANQSERQLGAFIASHLIDTGQKPEILNNKSVKFRNDVIHKGKFPDRIETINFAKLVTNCANPILKILKSNEYSDIINIMTMNNVRHKYSNITSDNANVSAISIHTFFSLSWVDDPQDVEVAVANCPSPDNFGLAFM